MEHSKNLLTETQAAGFLGFSIKTLQCWRWKKRGPRFLKLNGNCVRYREADLIDFTASAVVETRDSVAAK